MHKALGFGFASYVRQITNTPMRQWHSLPSWNCSTPLPADARIALSLFENNRLVIGRHLNALGMHKALGFGFASYVRQITNTPMRQWHSLPSWNCSTPLLADARIALSLFENNRLVIGGHLNALGMHKALGFGFANYIS
jgi:uncharacterized membrane protein YpjA